MQTRIMTSFHYPELDGDNFCRISKEIILGI
jgi:hypothetical protein